MPKPNKMEKKLLFTELISAAETQAEAWANWQMAAHECEVHDDQKACNSIPKFQTDHSDAETRSAEIRAKLLRGG